MVCSCFFVMKVLDIRCESYVFLIIRLCVVVGIGMIDFLFFMGFWVLDIDIYYMLNIVVIVCWYFFKENVLNIIKIYVMVD